MNPRRRDWAVGVVGFVMIAAVMLAILWQGTDPRG